MDSHTILRKKRSFFTKAWEYLTERVTPFLNKTKTVKKNVKIIFCDNAGENKTIEENYAEYFEEIKFEFSPPCTPQ